MAALQCRNGQSTGLKSDSAKKMGPSRSHREELHPPRSYECQLIQRRGCSRFHSSLMAWPDLDIDAMPASLFTSTLAFVSNLPSACVQSADCAIFYFRHTLRNKTHICEGGVMKWKPVLGDSSTDVLAIMTCSAVILAIWLIAGAGFFRPGGRYPTASELNQIGGFIGGIFAPIVLSWAARSFFLQRKQLLDSMQAMATQAELQSSANAQQYAQLVALERHREEDRRMEDERTAPRFSLRSITNIWSEEKKGRLHKTEITNVGALAVGYRLRVHSVNLVGEKPYSVHFEESALPFRPGESRQIDVCIKAGLDSQITNRGFTCEIEIMRADQRVTFQAFSSNDLLNYFEPTIFDAVDEHRKFRLAAFGGK